MSSFEIEKALADIQKLGFVRSGSRRVLKDDPRITEDTDYDFIADEKDSNKIREIGFFECNDDLENPYKYDGYTLSIFKKKSTFGGNLPIQIVVKDSDCYGRIVDMWVFLEANPSVFIEKIWKRGDTEDATDIAENIVALYDSELF